MDNHKEDIQTLAKLIREREPNLAEKLTDQHLRAVAESALIAKGAVNEEAVIDGVFKMELGETFLHLSDSEEEKAVSPAESARRGAEKSGKRETPNLPRHMLSDAMVTRSALLRSIDPAVSEFRNRLFGSDSPPFRGDKAAGEWVEKHQAPPGKPFSREELAHWFQMHDDLNSAAKKLEDFIRKPVRINFDSPVIRYYGRTGRRRYVGRAVVPTDSPLLELSDLVDEIYEPIAFPKEDLVRYILTGHKPDPFRWHIDAILDAATQFQEVTVRFSTQNICWEDMRLIYSSIQQKHERKANLIDEKDKAVWESVQRLGEGGFPPRENKTKFWEKVLRDVRRRNGFPWKGWQTPRKRWFNLTENNPWLPCLILRDEDEAES